MRISTLLYGAAFLSSVNGYKQVHRPKADEETTSEPPKPWVRTISSTIVEIVTPTVIAGVTFSGKPLETPDPLEPWVSLNKDGSPKTIKPEIKNGRTKNGHPDYKTYFQTAMVKTYSYEDLKAHNMDPDDVHEEEIFIDEDDSYTSLNPIIRCTPERYFKKGLAKDVPSEPFCTPRENVMWKVGKTYFITWYTKFFEDEHTGEIADNVRVLLSYVREKPSEKGFHKRDALALQKREVKGTFYYSEWLKNEDGVLPIEIDEEWLQDAYERRVVVSVQPDYITDEDFNPLQNGVMLHISMGSKVSKTTKEMWALEDAGISDDKWYYVALTIPTVIVVVCVVIYFFLHVNGRYRDFSDVTRNTLGKKHRILGTFKNMKKFKNMKNHTYSELPSYRKNSKQS